MGITQKELGAEHWDYVALGHYHVYRQVEPKAFYSGSLDYTSTNSWGEMAEEREMGIGGEGGIEDGISTGAPTFPVVSPHPQGGGFPPLFRAGPAAGAPRAGNLGGAR